MAMDEFSARSSAASRLRKKKGKPSDVEGMDELGLPPEDEMPVDEGAAPPDLAALLGGGGDMSAPPPEGEMGMEGMPPEAGADAGGTDIEMALAGVDAALQGMPPQDAEEVRTHMNAIREIVARGASSGAPPMEPQPAPGAGMGMPESGVIPS